MTSKEWQVKSGKSKETKQERDVDIDRSRVTRNKLGLSCAKLRPA